jgi:glycerol-3-phosphate dehydrogenase
MSRPSTDYDVIVIGGGITGAGVARDAALRGLRTLLLEKGDFASGTSSKTTRLVHGGLRYLANLELSLVMESVQERGLLRRLAPYLIRPIPILLPIYAGDRFGRAAVSMGVHLYDLLSPEQDLPRSRTQGVARTLAVEPSLARKGLRGSALLCDHQMLMPERLVIENVVGAREAGATVRSYVKVQRIEESATGLRVFARDAFSGDEIKCRASVVVNATGPWADELRSAAGVNDGRVIHPSKGVHLVLSQPRQHALLAAARDDRMCFVVPFGTGTLVGTTDTTYDGDLDRVPVEAVEVQYLLEQCHRLLPGLHVGREAVRFAYAGVRPLAFTGPREDRISRAHRVVREGRTGCLITVVGGKLTTYRRMAEAGVDLACQLVGVRGPCTTDRAPFPGGLPVDYDEYLRDAAPELAARYGVDTGVARHLIRWYGARAERVLEIAREDTRLRARISPECRDLGAQVAYAIREEGARTLGDVVLRRLQLGITVSRGLAHLEIVGEVAGRELGWSADETADAVRELEDEIIGQSLD